jgi:hypothetical protein
MRFDLTCQATSGEQQAEFHVQREGVFRQIGTRNKKPNFIGDRTLDVQNSELS